MTAGQVQRKLVVITAEMVMFKVRATRWLPRAGRTDNPEDPLGIVVYNGGMSVDIVAEFPDVHAVFFEDSGEMIKPDEDD